MRVFRVIKNANYCVMSNYHLKDKNLSQYISFNNGEPMLDIRKWNRNNNTMIKGVALTVEEAIKLIEAIDTIRP